MTFAATVAPTSNNWAGYVATGGQYTSVGGSWIVPAVNSSGVQSADATWVGIGGASSKDLIQSGTQAFVSATGVVTYNSWYELLPDGEVDFSVPVKPEDSVSVLISQLSGNLWHISFVNNTTGVSDAVNVNYTSTLSSAEWIEEVPMMDSTMTVLDSFGVTDFMKAYAVNNGNLSSLAQLGATTITMTNSTHQIIAYPSAIGTDGASFIVTRNNTVSGSIAMLPVYQTLIVNSRGVVNFKTSAFMRRAAQKTRKRVNFG